ncbi:MAG: rhodanese-like domain-containing protein [Actinobacteria bacterium]|nr:rhodanese-like domain-containing protein [Actinomycetota bacterium]
MPHLRKYLAIALLIASVSLAFGCSAGQVTDEDLGITAAKNEQAPAAPQAPPETPPTVQTTQPTAPPPWKNISASDASALISGNPAVQIVDLRSSYLYGNKHILGAKLLPQGELATRFGELDKTKPVLLYDDAGKWSKDAAKLLTDNGFSEVYELDGGIASWTYGVGP